MKTERIQMVTKSFSILFFPLVLALISGLLVAWAEPALSGKLVQAAKQGDLGEVKSLQFKGPEANACASSTSPALPNNLEAEELPVEKGTYVSPPAAQHAFNDLKVAANSGQKELAKPSRSRRAEISLEKAIDLGEVSEAQRLIRDGANINEWYTDGSYPLIKAAGKGQFGVVKLLLEEGADPNKRGWQDETSLMRASGKGHLEVARLLLDRGADVNARDTLNQTALTRASGTGNAELVRLLLDKGADINAKDERGSTALKQAVLNDDIPLIKLLAERGADLKKTKSLVKTALLAAFRNDTYSEVRSLLLTWDDIIVKEPGKPFILKNGWADHLPLIKLLVDRGADINDKDEYGGTPLIWAVILGETDIVKLLLQKSALVNTTDNWCRTALEWAVSLRRNSLVKLLRAHGAQETLWVSVRLGGEEEVERLIEKGLDVNAKDACGRTALMEAVRNNDLKTIRLLVDKGADICAQDQDGRSPLMRAEMSDSEGAIFRTLFMMPAGLTETAQEDTTAFVESAWVGNPGAKSLIGDVSIKDRHGKTILLSAVEGGHPVLVKRLLDRGADVNAVQNDGLTVVKTAVIRGDVPMVRLLRAYGAELTLSMAAMLGDSKEIDRLLTAGADINAMRERGRTVLMWATAAGQIEAAKLLLAKGADVNAANAAGETPLILAVENDHLDMVRLLLEKGAKANAAMSEGMTALMIAARQRNLGIVKLLLEKGADVHTKTPTDVTALEIMSGGGYSEIEKAFKARGAKKRPPKPITSFGGLTSPIVVNGSPMPTSPYLNIRLNSQEVTIRLGEDGYDVDAVFHLFNCGETTTEWIGFPKQDEITPSFLWCDVWTNGSKVGGSEMRNWADIGSADSRYSPPVNPWLAHKVTFPGHKSTPVRVSYRARYCSSPEAPGPRPYAPFVYGSGGHWKDTIESAVFTIDGTAIGGVEHFDVQFSEPTMSRRLVNRNAMRYKMKNLEPSPDATIGITVRE